MKQVFLLIAACALSACEDGMTFGAPPATEVSLSRDATGRCFVRDISPAVIEVVTDQEVVVPEVRDASGNVIQPAVIRKIDRPAVTETRDQTLFEALCPERLTPDLVSTLQRALAARGDYRGSITGTYDRNTARAVQRHQKSRGLDSPTLAIMTARDLGLIVVDLTEPADTQ
ncbi:MAG: peptidoglycan-binding domain-containing protein [Paracoccaceae bacterium]|jgi:hypothetical protein|nr:peptidoglycan-binding domain-containing protein [Paracoccaceae bacterium]